MRKIFIVTLSTVLLTALAGCADDVSGGTASGGMEEYVQISSAGAEDGLPDQTSVTLQDSSDVTYADTVYLQDQNILERSDTALANGISHAVLDMECTQAFGSRKLENLSDWIAVDANGNLTTEESYLFMTIQFTNTTDRPVEIYRNQGGIYAISSEKEILEYSSAAVYYDEPWNKGEEGEVFHWVLEPGESITSEIGWLLPAWEEVKSDFGTDRSWSLYYGVMVDSSREYPENLYINLEMKME